MTKIFFTILISMLSAPILYSQHEHHQMSYYGAPESLSTFYGKNPMAFQVYLRLYPALMKMNK